MSGTVAVSDLLGCWRLAGWSLIYEDGRPDEFPLGRDALGFITYTADGRVSVVLSRADRPKSAPASIEEKAAAFGQSFAYAGSYVIENGEAQHTIDIATNPALIGMIVKRDVLIDGGRLTITGADFAAGARRTQKIVWSRIGS